MDRFLELPVSVFDSEFTLNPYDELADITPRDDVLGFHSEGRNFLFRHDYAQACKSNGLPDDLIKCNIIGPLIISASNTMGLSSAFLRHMAKGFLRYLPENASIEDADIEIGSLSVLSKVCRLSWALRRPIRGGEPVNE